jgi:hypothetical protein
VSAHYYYNYYNYYLYDSNCIAVSTDVLIEPTQQLVVRTHMTMFSDSCSVLFNDTTGHNCAAQVFKGIVLTNMVLHAC